MIDCELRPGSGSRFALSGGEESLFAKSFHSDGERTFRALLVAWAFVEGRTDGVLPAATNGRVLINCEELMDKSLRDTDVLLGICSIANEGSSIDEAAEAGG